jgi:hypothetical protein
MTMTPETGDVLRKSLNHFDRERRRAVWLLAMLFVIMVGSWVGMMITGNYQTRSLAFGLAAVVEAIFIGGLMVVQVSNANTRTILKAIEMLSEKERKELEPPALR